MTDPIDTKARECAKEVFVAQERYCATNHKTLADTEAIIAAAMREVCEQKDREIAAWKQATDGERNIHMTTIAERDRLRHENNCLLVRLNAETDVLRQEATRLAAEVEQEKRLRQIMETRHGEVVVQSTNLRALLDVAEGALKKAEPFVTAAVVQEDEVGPHTDPDARAASLSVEQALTRIAGARTP